MAEGDKELMTPEKVRYPAFGPVSWRGDVGNSNFNALQLKRREKSSGILVRYPLRDLLHVTFVHFIDGNFTRMKTF